MAIPAAFMVSRKRSRSSAFRIASRLAPISFTPSRSRVPFSARATAVLSAVCPPRVGRMASTCSCSRIRATTSGVMGSR